MSATSGISWILRRDLCRKRGDRSLNDDGARENDICRDGPHFLIVLQNAEFHPSAARPRAVTAGESCVMTVASLDASCPALCRSKPTRRRNRAISEQFPSIEMIRRSTAVLIPPFEGEFSYLRTPSVKLQTLSQPVSRR